MGFKQLTSSNKMTTGVFLFSFIDISLLMMNKVIIANRQKPWNIFNQWSSFEFGFKLMKPFGECKEPSTIKDKALRFFTNLVTVGVFACSLISLYTIDDHINALNDFISICHVLSKYYWFVYYRPTGAALFKEIYTFWDKREFSKEIHQHVDEVLKTLKRLETVLLVLVTSVAVLYGTAPLLFSDKPYVLHVGLDIESVITKTIVLLSQYYFLALSGCAVVAYDAIYISSCCYVLIQIKLLHFIMASLEPTASRKKFINCIKHHTFILNPTSRIKKQYSLLFLVQYMMTVISICNQLLLLADRTSMVNPQSITAAIYLTFVFLQFGVYCVPAEQVGSSIMDLSNVIFSSRWHQHPVQWRSEIVFIIMRTHQQTYFTIGGLYDMNMETLVKMFKTAFSFHTFVNNVIILKE